MRLIVFFSCTSRSQCLGRELIPLDDYAYDEDDDTRMSLLVLYTLIITRSCSQ